MRILVCAEGDIDFPVQRHLGQLQGCSVHQRHFHIRRSGAEPAHHLRQQAVDRVVVETDPQLARHAALDKLGQVNRVFELANEVRGVLGKNPSRVRQPHDTGRALEQAGADALFEFLDRAAQGRLRDAQILRRAAETKLFRHRVERTNMPKLYSHYYILCINYCLIDIRVCHNCDLTFTNNLQKALRPAQRPEFLRRERAHEME